MKLTASLPVITVTAEAKRNPTPRHDLDLHQANTMNEQSKPQSKLLPVKVKLGPAGWQELGKAPDDDVRKSTVQRLSQRVLGHRLINDRDREVVERACGEIDRSAAAFLPTLGPGEAALIGVDFSIPLTVQMDKPRIEPKSQGPDFQAAWVEKVVTPEDEVPF